MNIDEIKALAWEISEWIRSEYRLPAISKSTLNRRILYAYLPKHPECKDLSLIPFVKITRILVEEQGLLSVPLIPICSVPYFDCTPFKKSFESSDFEGSLIKISSILDYGYLSYLSAMAAYGLTEIRPVIFDYTRTSFHTWESNSYRDLTFFLSDIGWKKRLRIREYKFLECPYPVETPEYRDHLRFHVNTKQKEWDLTPVVHWGKIRVPSIEQVFVEMIREPDRCGQIDHVIDVWRERAPDFQKEIENWIEQFGTKIDKARAGFLLEVICGCSQSDLITKWKKEASNCRGGSRKFLSDKKFSSVYSPEWNLSLNIEGLHKYGRES